MRLHNFFIEEQIGDRSRVEIADSDLINQWRNVFRMNTGASVVLLDNSGFEYTAQFTTLNYLKAELVVLEKRKNKFAPKTEVTIFQSLIKSDKFEWILEKGTELGVTAFQPVLSQRSVAKKLNLVRAKKILKESSEQSGRGVLPTISEPVSLEAALLRLPLPALALDPSGSPIRDSLFLPARRSSGAGGIPDSVSLFVGPEGGWTDQELALFKEKNIPIISLGTQILRAETAAVAVSALLLL